VAGTDRARRGDLLRLVSYNVHDLRDDRDAVAHVLRSMRCDVACLQEVPRRWFERPRVSRLARECGLRWASGGRPSGGTAVFVSHRVDLVAATAFRLPVRGPFTRSRGTATATVDLAGARLTAVSVHLPLEPAQRVSHARIVRARLAAHLAGGSWPTSLVVAGDLNEPPGGPAWEVLGAGLTDAAAVDGEPAPTFTARRPVRRIDAVLVGRGLRVGPVRVPGSVGAGADVADGVWPEVRPEDLWSASDHLPVVVDLLLGSGG
jgi:endonuclease/exonuclease/phosphatase family metal-dependent hydrolase